MLGWFGALYAAEVDVRWLRRQGPRGLNLVRCIRVTACVLLS